ncbi:MAG: hypothetical protein OEV88_17190, partial [Gammaproteobacteria bacterium]|nr:hypothetical protein [Gammaproteobacteria bacterium]
KEAEVSQAPEEKIFDKAVKAASLEELKLNLEDIREKLEAARTAMKEAGADGGDAIKAQIADLEKREEWCARMIEQQA